MRTAIYPGSFDPVTLGHMNIIERATSIFDKLIVCILVNHEKSPMFTVEERIEFLKKATAHLKNVEVTSGSGLLTPFAKKVGADVVVKGLRSGVDFEKEQTMAHYNLKIEQGIETLFLPADEKFLFLSSTAVRELALFGYDIDEYVPEIIIEDIKNKTKQRRLRK